MPIISKEMGPKWGTSKNEGPYANRFGTMSDDEREELGSGIVGAFNILADDRCTHHVFWTPGSATLHVDQEELTTLEDWDEWLAEVETRLTDVASDEPRNYPNMAKLLIEWARQLVNSTTGFAKNTEAVQSWLDDTGAISSWTEISDEVIRFKFDPSAKPQTIPADIEFDFKGELSKLAEED